MLLRVSASVPPIVQLPGVIGGRASLNLLCACVGRPGTDKGASAKAAALAWPADFLVLPLGSGQEIAELFAKRSAVRAEVATTRPMSQSLTIDQCATALLSRLLKRNHLGVVASHADAEVVSQFFSSETDLLKDWNGMVASGAATAPFAEAG